MQPIKPPTPMTIGDIAQQALGLAGQIQTARALPQRLQQEAAQRQATLGLTQAQAGAIPSEEASREAQANLAQAQAGLVPAKIALARAQAFRALVGESQKPLSPTGQLIHDRQYYARTQGEGSQPVKQIDSVLHSSVVQKQIGALPLEEQNALKAEGTNWVKASQAASDTAEKAGQGQQDINDFVNAYNQLSSWERGTLGRGYIGYFTSAGQLARKAQSRLALMLLAMQKFGRVTNKEMGIVQSGTLNIHMNPQAVIQLSKELRALFTRQQEYPKFLAALKNAGVTDTSIARTLWTEYTHQHPMITEDNQVHMENLPKWRNYISKEAIQAARTGKTYYSPEFMQSIQETAQQHNEIPQQVIQNLTKIRGGL